ncbi:MAG: ABC transporter ATP-binding protein, partial [Polyangiaceae bacterium]
LDEIRAKSGKVRYVVSVQESAAGNSPYRGASAPPKLSEVDAALNAIKGVKKVGELPTDERAHSYELTSERDVDLRPEIFKLMVDKGWVLLELHRDTQTLEDVFRNLTIGEERKNRKLSKAGRPIVEEAVEEEEEDDEDEEEEDEEEQDEEEEESPKKKGSKR